MKLLKKLIKHFTFSKHYPKVKHPNNTLSEGGSQTMSIEDRIDQILAAVPAD